MKKKLAEILQKQWFYYAVLFLISLIIAYPLLKIQIKETHDGNLHILRLMGTTLSQSYSSFPHLVIPFFCRNFGYSINAFYSPLVTYLPHLFTAFSSLYANALKIFSYFTILFSGIAMYHCCFEITKKKGASLFASILYMMAPYRLEDMYIRFALGEFTAFIFIPIIFERTI